MDYNGKLAICGKVNDDVLNSMLKHKFFKIQPPKAADNTTFDDKLEHLEGLSLEDGAATVTAFVAESIIRAIDDFVPILPKKVIICGGGAKNPTMMRFLRQRTKTLQIETAAECEMDAMAIEAQAFGYLAVRRMHQMPTSYPFTTGALVEVIGGEVFEPKKIGD